MPTSSNLIDWAGNPITGGLAQYAERDHFAVFDSNSAAKLVYDFLASALEDNPPRSAKTQVRLAAP